MRQTFFSDIAPGGCRSGGGEAPESIYRNEGFNKARISNNETLFRDVFPGSFHIGLVNSNNQFLRGYPEMNIFQG